MTVGSGKSVFYFDFRDNAKKDVRGLLSSILTQLGARSDLYNDLLSELYSTYDSGLHQPDEAALTECLMKMLKLPGHPAIYIIIDALDECPTTLGMVSARERVLYLVEDVMALQLPNLRICITSRPEADIRTSLGHLASNTVSIHDESGQQQDIIDYINFVVQTDRNMRGWRAKDKNLVIDALSEKADGM